MAQTVKNLLAMQETWVQSLNQKDQLEKGTATQSSILAWMDKKSLAGHSPRGGLRLTNYVTELGLKSKSDFECGKTVGEKVKKQTEIRL